MTEQIKAKVDDNIWLLELSVTERGGEPFYSESAATVVKVQPYDAVIRREPDTGWNISIPSIYGEVDARYDDEDEGSSIFRVACLRDIENMEMGRLALKEYLEENHMGATRMLKVFLKARCMKDAVPGDHSDEVSGVLELTQGIRPATNLSIEVSKNLADNRDDAEAIRADVAGTLIENGFESMADRFLYATHEVKNTRPMLVIAASFVSLEPKSINSFLKETG